jgi:hypothetical protein
MKLSFFYSNPSISDLKLPIQEIPPARYGVISVVNTPTIFICIAKNIFCILKKSIMQINKSNALNAGSIRGVHFQSVTSVEDKITSRIIG